MILYKNSTHIFCISIKLPEPEKSTWSFTEQMVLVKSIAEILFDEDKVYDKSNSRPMDRVLPTK